MQSPSTGVASTCNKAADLAITMGNCPSEKRGECQDTPSRASVTYLIICVLLEYCNFEDDMLSYQSCCIMCCLPCVLLLFTLLACCVCVLGYFVLLTLFCFALRCFAFALLTLWVACVGLLACCLKMPLFYFKKNCTHKHKRNLPSHVTTVNTNTHTKIFVLRRLKTHGRQHEAQSNTPHIYSATSLKLERLSVPTIHLLPWSLASARRAAIAPASAAISPHDFTK